MALPTLFYIILFPQLEKLSLRQLTVAWQIRVTNFEFEDRFTSNTDLSISELKVAQNSAQNNY